MNADTILKIIGFIFKWCFVLTALIIVAVQLGGAFSRDYTVQMEYCYHNPTRVHMCDYITVKFNNIPRGTAQDETERRHWMDSVATDILKNANRLMENAK
jgi:hypothetical protein